MATTLRGTVTLETGEPARTATVELHNSSGDVLDQIVCDDEGHFIYHLVPGSWRLRVWDQQGGRAEISVQLDKDQDAAVSIGLSKGRAELNRN